jgi:nitrite reductase/ring-hydroxylating ferredoxin subunit
MDVRVPRVGSLAHGEAITFPYLRDNEMEEGFVLRVGEELVAYRNLCAHWTVDLDMGEGKFWSTRFGRIHCQTHGALYEPTTGVCDAGPCVGGRLEKFEVRRDGADAVVTIPTSGATPGG